MSNRDFRNLLRIVESRIKNAKNSKDIVDSVSLVKAYNMPLKFDNKGIFINAFFLGVFSILLFIEPLFFSSQSEQLLASFALLLSSIALVYFSHYRNQQLSKLSDMAFQRDSEFDNDVTLTSLWIDKAQKSFFVFSSGSQSGSIPESKYINAYGKLLYFHHYYEEGGQKKEFMNTGGFSGKSIESTKSVGGVRYDRYGVIAPFEGFSGILVKESIVGFPHFDKFEFEPALNSFNHNIDAYGNSELEIAKFLKPAVVEKIDMLADVYSDLCIEINHGAICISTSQQLFTEVTRQSGYDLPDSFEEELSGKTKYKNLEMLWVFIEYLRFNHRM